MTPLRLALLALSALAAGAALAQNAPVAVARATIESVAPDGASLAVRTRAGEDRTVRLNPKALFILVAPATLADVKPGAFIGVAAMPGEGGELKAMEVHIFPEAMRGTGEGFRPFDLAPGSSMTNGAIAARVDADERAEAHRDLQGRPADDRRRSEDADRRLRSRARRTTSSRARRSSRAGQSRMTARSTPPSS